MASENKSFVPVDELMETISLHQAAPAAPPAAAPSALKLNLPLAQSENERARGLVDLDRKFVVDVAAMSPKASAYFRQRSFLSPEVCRQWRMGYLPRDTGEDKS